MRWRGEGSDAVDERRMREEELRERGCERLGGHVLGGGGWKRVGLMRGG